MDWVFYKKRKRIGDTYDTKYEISPYPLATIWEEWIRFPRYNTILDALN